MKADTSFMFPLIFPRSYRKTPRVILRAILQSFTDFQKMPEASLQQYSFDTEVKGMQVYVERGSAPVCQLLPPSWDPEASSAPACWAGEDFRKILNMTSGSLLRSLRCMLTLAC